MKASPILFSAPMVRALLAGKKTQTRRIFFAEPQGPNSGKVIHKFGPGKFCPWEGDLDDKGMPLAPRFPDGACLVEIPCPYGAPGDVLWVRETLREGPDGWQYAADGAPVQLAEGDPRMGQMLSWAHHKEGNTCVSIHMPRWASRLSLEVIEVRVQRLTTISEADAIAEGLSLSDAIKAKVPSVRDVYALLWDDINGAKVPWSSNPWVWVITFKRVMP